MTLADLLNNEQEEVKNVAPIRNCEMVLDEKTGILTIRINLLDKSSHQESKSAKSIIIGTTGGNKDVPNTHGKIKIGVNCYMPIPKGNKK